MKPILLLIIGWLTISGLQAQSKKELQDYNNLLKQQLQYFKSQNDSLQKQADIGLNFINQLQLSYLPEGSPVSLSYTKAYIDSLITAGTQDQTEGTIDSLTLMKDSIKNQWALLDTLKHENRIFRELLGILVDEKEYPRKEQDLLGTWQFIINPISIERDSLYAGLRTYSRMNLSDSVLNGMIRQITFMEDDLADVVFMDGRDEKCFYEVSGFSREQTYTIHFDRKDELNMYLTVTHLPNGIQISYQAENSPDSDLFYLGFMKR